MPNDNLKKYYSYLKSSGADVAPTYDAFATTLSNEENAKKYHSYLLNNGFDTPKSYDSFSQTLGLKKKDLTASGSAVPSSERLSKTTTKLTASSSSKGRADGLYSFPGQENATYKKENGQWSVAFDGSYKYIPLQKGDVQARVANLEKNAVSLEQYGFETKPRKEEQPKYTAAPKPKPAAKPQTAEQKKEQAVFDKSFGVVSEAEYQKRKAASESIDAKVNQITPDFINDNEEDVVPKVQDLIKDYPYLQVSQSGNMYDELEIKNTITGESKKINLENWTSDRDKEEAKRLQGFLDIQMSTKDYTYQYDKVNKLKEQMATATPTERINLSQQLLEEQAKLTDLKNGRYNKARADKYKEAAIYDKNAAENIKTEYAKLQIRSIDYAEKVKSYNDWSQKVTEARDKGLITDEQYETEYAPKLQAEKNMLNDEKLQINESFNQVRSDSTSIDNIAASEYAIQAERGNVLSGATYSFLEGAENSLRFLLETGDFKDGEFKGFLTDAAPGSISKMYTSAEGRNAFEQIIFGLANSGGSALVSAAAGTPWLGLYASSYVNMKDQMSTPQFKDVPEYQKILMSGIYGATIGYLENKGIGKWFQKTPAGKGLTNWILKKTISDLGKDATAETIELTIKKNLGAAIKNGLIQVTASGLVEGSTELAQEATDIVYKEVFNRLADKEYFENPTSWTEVANRLSQSFVLGFAGAAGMQSITQATQVGMNELDKKQINNLTELIDNPELKNVFKLNLKDQILSGQISKQEAQRQIFKINEIEGALNKIPSNVDKFQAFKLINERDAIQKEIAGKDPALVAAQTERVNAINDELKQLSYAVQEQATSEVPVQPGAAVSGEVAQGEPETRLEETTQEGEQEKVTAQINVAPLFDTKVTNVQEAEAIRNSEMYQQYKKDMTDAAKQFGVEVDAIDDTIGGYAGTSEVSTVVNVTGDWNNIIEFAAAYGAMAPEVQDSTIAGRTVEAQTTEHNADRFDIGIDNQEAALKAAEDAGFSQDGFTMSGDKIMFFNIFDFPVENFDEKYATFVDKYIEYGGKITSESKSAVQSEFIDSFRRAEILTEAERNAVQQTGRESVRDVIKKAKERNFPYTVAKAKSDQINLVSNENIDEVIKNQDTATKQGLAKNAKLVMKAIPGVKIYLHNNTAEYNGAVGEETDGTEKGSFIASDGAIHINMQEAFPHTLLHEAFHYVILNKGIDGKTLNGWAKSLRSIIKDKKVLDRIDRLIKNYSTEEQAEEFISELGGIMGAAKGQLTTSALQKFKTLINKIAKAIGLPPIFTAASTTQDAVDFINTISKQLVTGEEIEVNEPGTGGEIGTFNVPKRKLQKAIKVSEDPRDFIRKFVQDIDIREFNGKKFITNMYDYTNAGDTDLGNGFKITMLGGKNYVPLMMELNGKGIGDVSNLAAFNTREQAETFIRNAELGGASLFAPHAGTLDQSWQFQQHTFAELFNLVLDNDILTAKELIDVFNNTIKDSKDNQKQFNQFATKYGEDIKNFDSFESDPKKIIDLLDIKNNYSPKLRKALNNAIASNKKFQQAIGVKNKNEFYNRIMDPLNQGMKGGEIMNIVDFDPTTFQIVETKPNNTDHHPSFGFTLLAKINGIYQPTELVKSVDITDSYTKYNQDGEKTSRKAEEPKFEEKNVSSSAGAIPKTAQFNIPSNRKKQIVEKERFNQKLSSTELNALRTSIRNRFPDSYTIEILDEVFNSIKTGDSNLPFELDYLNDGVTLNDVLKLLNEDEVFESTNEAKNFLRDRALSGDLLNAKIAKKQKGFSKQDAIRKAKEKYVLSVKERGNTPEQGVNSALEDLRKSEWYNEADDIMREEAERELKKFFGQKMKAAPSIKKIMAIPATETQTKTVNSLRKEFWTAWNKSARETTADLNAKRKVLSMTISSMANDGKINSSQASSIINKIGKVNLNNPIMVKRLIDFAERVFARADYQERLSEAAKLRKSIKKAMRSKDIQAEVVGMAKRFSNIDPFMVEYIDQYIENAEKVLSAVRPVRGMDVALRQAADIAAINEFSEKEIARQEENKKRELMSEHKYLVDSGAITEDMTSKEMQEIIDILETKNEEIDGTDKKMEFLKNRFEFMAGIIKEMIVNNKDIFTNESLDLTSKQRELMSKIIKMDIDKMTIKQAAQVLEAMDNFMNNGITSGLEAVVQNYEGMINADGLASKGWRSIPLRKYFIKPLGRLYGEQVVSLPLLVERMFIGMSRGLEFMNKMGLNDLIKGVAKADYEYKQIINNYSDQSFYNQKGFMEAENVYERGMIAFLSRNLAGSKTEMRNEFLRRIKLIEESINELMDGTSKEIKMGEAYQKVYNKLKVDSQDLDVIKANAEKMNIDAVDWMTQQWAEKYSDLSDISLSVYNTILGSDTNYTPDRFKTLGSKKNKVDEELLKRGGAFMNTIDYTDKKQSGVLMETTRPKVLPEGRFVSLDFDANNFSSLKGAIVDIETAAAIRKIDGFMNSKGFNKMINGDDRDLLERRVNNYIIKVKGKDRIDKDTMRILDRSVNFLGSLGVGKALGGLDQVVKQTAPVVLNTFINAGRFDPLNLEMNEAINRSGMPIANRGLESAVSIESIDSLLDKKGARLTEFAKKIEKVSQMYMKALLSKPDVWVARSSFISYYNQYLKNNGISTDIDWQTHEWNQDAMDYAQMMVDRQQNISDEKLAGSFMSSQDPFKKIARKVIFPFATFILNQKARMFNDFSTIFRPGAEASSEDKKKAARSLSGLAAEIVSYQLISYLFKTLVYDYFAGKISGEDEEDEKKERSFFGIKMTKKQWNATKFPLKSLLSDLISPIPFLDEGVSVSFDKIMSYVPMISDEDIKKAVQDQNDARILKGDEAMNAEQEANFVKKLKEENTYSVSFQKESYGKQYGVAGIAFDTYTELAEMAQLAYSGEFEDDMGYGPKVKHISKDDQEIVKYMLLPMTLYATGLLPKDAGVISRKVVNTIKKRSISDNKFKNIGYLKEELGRQPKEWEKSLVMNTKKKVNTIKDAIAFAERFGGLTESQGKEFAKLIELTGDYGYMDLKRIQDNETADQILKK